MACKFASPMVYVGDDEYDEIEIDGNAHFVGDAGYQDVTAVDRSLLSTSSSLPASIPREALNIVQTGSLREPFHNSYKSTIGACFKVAADINLGKGAKAKAQLWDTAGQERFRTIGRSYYRGAQLALVVYDINDARSGAVENLRRWIDEVRESNPDCVMCIFGNKLDLAERRQVPTATVMALAEEMGLFFAEVSAKTGENLTAAFARMYSEMYMSYWQRRQEMSLIKAVIVGDSGVGKTSLFDRLGGFAIDLEPLATRYPIAGGAAARAGAAVAAAPPPAPKGRVQQKRVRRADTNVFSLNLALLVGEAHIVTGDPLFCSDCRAAFSVNSAVQPAATDDETPTWTCEFCGAKNEMTLADEERPTVQDVDYMVAPPPAAAPGSEDDQVVVFCIDTSGSMAVAEAMKGAAKNADAKRLQDLKKKKLTSQGMDAFLAENTVPLAERNTLYVSRLEAVQAAVEAQLISLQREHPNRKVAVVGFNTDVVVYGDGSTEPVTLAGDMLSDAARLREAVGVVGDAKGKRPASAANSELRPIATSRLGLSTRLFELLEDGQTALGPALVVSLELASRRPGSKVVLCTDGLANVGIGRMDEGVTQAETAAFYNELGVAALAANATISLMSFRGADCNVEVLGSIATRTGGQVEIVSPAEVQRNFRAVFADDTVATGVAVSTFFPAGLAMRPASGGDLDGWTDLRGAGARFLRKELGNINADSNLLVEYSVDAAQFADSVGARSIPFQLQVEYTRIEDGARLVRVVSRSYTTTRDRQAAEAVADVEVVALDGVRRAAAVAQAGDYMAARLQNVAHRKLVERVVAAQDVEARDVMANYMVHSATFDREVRNEQLQERERGRLWDDTAVAGEVDEAPADGGSGWFKRGISWLASKTGRTAAGPPPPAGMPGAAPMAASHLAPPAAASPAALDDVRRERANGRSDGMAKMLWTMKSQNYL